LLLVIAKKIFNHSFIIVFIVVTWEVHLDHSLSVSMRTNLAD